MKRSNFNQNSYAVKIVIQSNLNLPHLEHSSIHKWCEFMQPISKRFEKSIIWMQMAEHAMFVSIRLGKTAMHSKDGNEVKVFPNLCTSQKNANAHEVGPFWLFKLFHITLKTWINNFCFVEWEWISTFQIVQIRCCSWVFAIVFFNIDESNRICKTNIVHIN